MIKIGNFFFRYRNGLFIFLYLLLFIPSPALFSEQQFGANYYLWPIIIGLVVTVSGQVIRGATIGLAYIIRGGSGGKVHAEDLVTSGIFNHCRNPLYVGNILMLTGVGILSNSMIYVLLVIPAFILIYQAIVLAEEDFLSKKFGDAFTVYCGRVNRWLPSLTGIGTTFRSMRFKWRRWLIKEYNTQFVWLCGIMLILLFKYPHITSYDAELRLKIIVISLVTLLSYYLFVRYMKKSRKWDE
ncbi:methyltransferase family protein [Flavitalea sp.]|nr:isoprenylcysteine carboxylmethyltransferase family protein [Flavitalea sp.]